jgi:hypothetical protein
MVQIGDLPSSGGSVATDAIWDAKGDLAVGTGADTASKLAVGNRKQVVRANSATSTGLEYGPAVLWPDLPPASPNTEDDEFDSASLNAKWTVVTNTAANSDINTTWPSHLYLNFTGNQAYVMKQPYAPAGAFSLTAKFRLAAQASYQQVSIDAYTASEADCVMASYGVTTPPNAQTVLHTRDSGNWYYNRTTLVVPLYNQVYLHLQRDGSNNWRTWISFDGYSFFPVSSVYSKTMTVNHFTIELNQSGAHTLARCGIDWVRRDWITL